MWASYIFGKEKHSSQVSGRDWGVWLGTCFSFLFSFAFLDFLLSLLSENFLSLINFLLVPSHASINIDLFRTIYWIYTNQKRQSGNDTNYHDLLWRSGYNRPQKSIFVLWADVLEAPKIGKCEHWASGYDSCFVCLVAACLCLFLQVRSGRQ